MNAKKACKAAGLAFSLWAACGSALALEPGTTPSYLNGAEGFMAAVAPPPGFYSLVYAASYGADRLNDSRGHDLRVPGFKTRADAVVARLAWVPGTRVLGGDLIVHTLIPLVHVSGRTAAGSQSKSGLGDITVGAGLGFHHSPRLHSVLALDLHLKTGSYDRADLVNLGNNRTAIEPVYGLSHIDPAGFNGDLRLGLSFNQKNSATQYQSGTDFHADYAAGWAVSPNWVLGVGGHYFQQLENDKLGGSTLADSKARSASIGPMLKFDSGRGWFFTLKWQKEFGVRNLPQGSGVYLKALLPI